MAVRTTLAMRKEVLYPEQTFLAVFQVRLPLQVVQVSVELQTVQLAPQAPQTGDGEAVVLTKNPVLQALQEVALAQVVQLPAQAVQAAAFKKNPFEQDWQAVAPVLLTNTGRASRRLTEVFGPRFGQHWKVGTCRRVWLPEFQRGLP